MFAHRETREGDGDDPVVVDVAFTDRHATAGPLDLARREGPPSLIRASIEAVAKEFAPGQPVVGMHQVHGADVHVLEGSHDGAEIVADGIVTRERGVTLLVRAADCVPLLLADLSHGVVGAVHSGRPGLVAGVVPAALAAMRALGAEDIDAWVGPHVCGACYEVPTQMRDDVSRAVPEAHAETSWGTPSVDIGAGVRAQLAAAGRVSVHEVARCTMEDADLWSYRREGTGAGRLGGLIGIRP